MDFVALFDTGIDRFDEARGLFAVFDTSRYHGVSWRWNRYIRRGASCDAGDGKRQKNEAWYFHD